MSGWTDFLIAVCFGLYWCTLPEATWRIRAFWIKAIDKENRSKNEKPKDDLDQWFF